MKLYKELTYEEVTNLSASSLAYISWDGRLRIPAFILPYPGKPNGLGFLYGKDVKDYNIKWLPFETYKEEWTVDVEDGFIVDTPDGVLHAFNDGGGNEYPGIRIDLYRPKDPNPISLAMTEYIPGGEPVWAGDDDIPVERIADKDGKPIVCKGEVADTSGHTVTAGLVSRAWPNEIAEEDYHKRVFHTGYKEEIK